jgi:hypothetical protein
MGGLGRNPLLCRRNCRGRSGALDGEELLPRVAGYGPARSSPPREARMPVAVESLEYSMTTGPGV